MDSPETIDRRQVSRKALEVLGIDNIGKASKLLGVDESEIRKEVKRKRADFKEKRNLDSGVWMGSDGSSSDCLLSSESSSYEDFMRAWSGQKQQELEQKPPVSEGCGVSPRRAVLVVRRPAERGCPAPGR